MLVLTVALVGPYFVDWTSYRADFEREASKILGRQVTVQGEASARILPFPSLTFTDVQVAGADGQPALTAEKFSMDSELAPFLRGELLIFDMRLERPKGVVRISENGGLDWAVRPNTPFDTKHVSLEKLTITEGQVTIEHAASGRTHRLTEINTDVSAKTLAGPWRVAGSMRLDGALTDFDASTGAVDDAGAMRVRVRANPQRYPFSIETDGSAAMKEGALDYSGNFKFSGYNSDNLLRASDGITFAPDQNGEKALPDYRASGLFSFDHRRISLSEFRFETGPLDNPYIAEGKADLDIGGEPHFSVEATGAQFSFDDRIAEDGQQAALGLGTRVAALKAFVAGLPRPTIPGTVNVSLPAIAVGDTTFRDVRLSAEPAPEGWQVEDFAVSMPGRSTLEANGLVAVSDEDVTFDGDLLLAVSQPSGFATWLSKEVDEAIRRLPAAGFQAKAKLSSKAQRLDDLQLRLGEATFRGDLDSLTPPNANPALLLKLDGGALDVEGLAAFASLFVTEDGRSRTADRDLDLEVTAGPVTAAGLTAEKVDAALRLKDGILDIDRLRLDDLAGTNVSATGKLTGFPEAPVGSVDATLTSSDISPLLQQIGERLPDNRVAAALGQRFALNPGMGEDARINAVATIARTDGKTRHAISAGGDLAGGKFTLAYAGSGTVDAPTDMSVDLSLNVADATNLLALYGLPTIPLLGLGPASSDLSLKGTPTTGLATKLTISGEDLTARYDGEVTAPPGAFGAKGKLDIEAGDAAPWLATTGIILPGAALGLPVKLSMPVELKDDVLALTGFSGAISGSAVSGDLTAKMDAGKPKLEGALTTQTLPLDLAVAAVLGEGTLVSESGDWAETAFPASSAAPFAADVRITAGEVENGSGVFARDASMNARLTGESLSLTDISAQMVGGRATGMVEVRNSGGTGAMTAQIKLADIELANLPGAGNLAGKADLSADLNGGGKTVAAIVTSLTGSGSLRSDQLRIDGVNPSAFGAMIAAADKAGRDINDAAVAAFAPQLAGQGAFDAGAVEIAYSIAGGVARTPPVTLRAPGATLAGDVRFDLPQWLIDARAELTYDAGDEALVGSQPALNVTAEGEPGAVAINFDTQPMAQFLTQRALEIEQARVEAMQAQLLEKQRLRREVRYYAALGKAREEARLRIEEEQRLKAEEEARLKAEEDARLKAEEEERRKAAEAEEKAKAEAQAKADAEAQAKADAAAKAEAEAKRKAGQDAAAAAKAKALEEAAAERNPEQPAAPSEGISLHNLLRAIEEKPQ